MTNELAIYSIDYGWAGIDVVVSTSEIEAAKIIISEGNNRHCYTNSNDDINKLANSLEKHSITDGLVIINYGDQ